MDLLRRQAVDLAFRLGDALEYRHRFLFHPGGERSLADQLPNAGEGAGLGVSVVRGVPAPAP